MPSVQWRVARLSGPIGKLVGAAFLSCRFAGAEPPQTSLATVLPRLTSAIKLLTMLPGILCLIVLAMPLAVAVSAAFSAWAEWQPRSARQYRLNAMAGDDVAD